MWMAFHPENVKVSLATDRLSTRTPYGVQQLSRQEEIEPGGQHP